MFINWFTIVVYNAYLSIGKVHRIVIKWDFLFIASIYENICRSWIYTTIFKSNVLIPNDLSIKEEGVPVKDTPSCSLI
jgi:hypothetical protein